MIDNDLWLSAKLSGSNIHNLFNMYKCHIITYLYIVQDASVSIYRNAGTRVLNFDQSKRRKLIFAAPSMH